MLSTVTSKGQVTIPKQMRDALNIHPNDKVEFQCDGQRIVMVPMKPLQQFRGAVRAKKTFTFEQERARAKTAMAHRAIEETR